MELILYQEESPGFPGEFCSTFSEKDKMPFGSFCELWLFGIIQCDIHSLGASGCLHWISRWAVCATELKDGVHFLPGPSPQGPKGVTATQGTENLTKQG